MTNTQIKKNLTRAFEYVAKGLNNTPAVSKKEYCSENITTAYTENPINFCMCRCADRTRMRPNPEKSNFAAIVQVVWQYHTK